MQKPAKSIDDKMNQFNQKAMLNQMLQQSNREYLDESAKYMLENPNIYQYDELYDDMKQTRDNMQEQKKERKKKNYTSVIANIRQAKIKRDRETSISVEALAKKDRLRNGLGEDEEQFVTSSYMKVMDENKKYQEEQRKRDIEIEKSTAQSRGNMSQFNKGLFNQGFYRGGDRVDLNQEMNRQKQESKIEQMLKIKQERMKQQEAIDNSYKQSIYEQYNIKKQQKEQEEKGELEKQFQDQDQNQERKSSRKSRSKDRKKEKKEKKDKKHSKKKDKKHRSRSRSRSKNSRKKDQKNKKRSLSQEKEQKNNSQEKQKPNKPRVPAFNSQKNNIAQEQQQDKEQKEQEQPKVQLTTEQKKQQVLERLKLRRLKQQQEQQEQQENNN